MFVCAFVFVLSYTNRAVRERFPSLLKLVGFVLSIFIDSLNTLCSEYILFIRYKVNH